MQSPAPEQTPTHAHRTLKHYAMGTHHMHFVPHPWGRPVPLTTPELGTNLSRFAELEMDGTSARADTARREAHMAGSHVIQPHAKLLPRLEPNNCGALRWDHPRWRCPHVRWVVAQPNEERLGEGGIRTGTQRQQWWRWCYRQLSPLGPLICGPFA